MRKSGLFVDVDRDYFRGVQKPVQRIVSYPHEKESVDAVLH